MSTEIKKLPQDLINKIAAGEVIERPSSIVKELIDNSIDAGADRIEINLKGGGIDEIIIRDNGVGIPKEQLKDAFEAHATSKVDSFEDLNSLLTMGFRGEALSTIVSIAEVQMISKFEDSDQAYKIQFEGIEPKEIEPAAGNQGTTIKISNIFKEVPARRKFLKKESTEYRNIMNILTPYLLNYPNISFEVSKDGKEIHNLPKIQGVKQPTLHPERVSAVIRGDFSDEMIDIFYDGDGIKVGGLIAHPSNHKKRTKHIYTFVNERPVDDKGLIRSVLEGYSRFIPHGEKVPFVLKVKVKPELVDVNVHPRKEEVRFINPYRVYSAVEKSVQSALQKAVKKDYQPEEYHSDSRGGRDSSENAYQRLRASVNRGSGTENSQRSYEDSGGTPKVYDYRSRPKRDEVQQGLKFSEALLRDSEDMLDQVDSGTADQVSVDDIISARQYFKKYLFFEFPNKLWVVDQHAAAERVTFEKLLRHREKNGDIDKQNKLVPDEYELDEDDAEFLDDLTPFLEELGFGVEINKNTVRINYIPVEFINADTKELIDELLQSSSFDIKNSTEKQIEDFIATVACHNSIRTNQKLSDEEAKSILEQLLNCDNPYSCPHGRPVIWKMTLEDIDNNFDRTY
jgi:DNA mismatch repair protein MutL